MMYGLVIKLKKRLIFFQNNSHINLIINNSEFTDENLKSNKINKIQNYLKINKNLNLYCGNVIVLLEKNF